MAKTLRFTAFVLLGAALCLAPAAPGQSVGGPVMGFVLDEAAGLRPILGMPGAATLGGPTRSLAGFGNVVFSLQRDYALALVQTDGRVVLVQDLSRLPRGNVLDLPPGAARIAPSPTGDAAAFYYRDSRTVKVVTGLPGSPVVSWTAELPELAGGLAALAVSDGGRGVLAAGTEQGLVLLAAPDLGTRTLWAVAGSPSVAFLVNSLDAVMADGVLNRVVVVRDPKGDAQVLQMADAAQGVSGPVAVTAASDGRRVFVANTEPPGVLALSLAGEDPITLPCDCRPTGLDRLAGDGVFRLNDARQGPLWLLDDTGASPRIVFVPYEQSQPSPRVLPVRARETGGGSAPRVRATR